MAITSTGLNAATNAEYTKTTTTANKTSLSKDDFMKLFLAEMQHQDPTEPMDSDKILSQTSQLAEIESADKTNKALEKLTAALGTSQQFSTIAAIGKTADLGSNAITLSEGSNSTFEVYFPDDIEQGDIQITDVNGKTLKTLDVGTNPKGVYKFTWDGTDTSGSELTSGTYYVSAAYTNPEGKALTTRMGAYPIESVKFDGATSYVKVGSNYVELSKVKEIY